jgi:uncharacterized membrane protein
MASDLLDNKATPGSLRCLARAEIFSSDDLERSLGIAGIIPNGKAWSRFLNMLFLLLGSVLVAAGVIFFFAFNWASMHRLLKLGVVEAALFIGVAVSFLSGIDKLAGKAALLVSSLLVGALLALYGQIYQTGADAYELFLGWSILIASWVVISRFSALWLLLLLLIEATVYLFWGQVVESAWFGYRSPLPYEIIFGLNVIGLALWEFFSARKVSWLAGRWIPRFCASLGLFVLMIPLVLSIVERHAFRDHADLTLLLWLLYGSSVTIVAWFYRMRVFDLYMIAIMLLSLIILAAVFFANTLGSDYTGFLFLSLLIVGMSAGAAMWLRRIAKTQSQEGV